MRPPIAVNLTDAEARALLLAIANLIEDESDHHTVEALRRANSKIRTARARRTTTAPG